MVDVRIQRADWDPDVVLYLRNVYRPSRFPYVVFIDNTASLTQDMWPDWTLPSRTAKWRQRVDQEHFQSAIHVFTAGRYVAHDVVASYGVSPLRVTAVGGGLNFPVPAKRLPLWTGTPTVLFVGTEFERKGGDLLFRSFAKVRDRIPDARLVLVGGDFSVRGTGVVVLGRIRDRAVLSDLYGRATIFCLPARFEPYGLVLQEAMAHGVPCVATRVGALPEILADGRCGVLVPANDVDALAEAVTSLLLDPAQRERLSEAAWKRVTSELTWDAVADRVLRQLSKVKLNGISPTAPSRKIGD